MIPTSYPAAAAAAAPMYPSSAPAAAGPAPPPQYPQLGPTTYTATASGAQYTAATGVGGYGAPPVYGGPAASAPAYGVVNVPSGSLSSMNLSQQQQQQQQMQAGLGAMMGQQPFGQMAGIDADVATRIGVAYGARAITAGQEYLNQNVNRWINIPQIKYYFAVSNTYVLRKLQLVLFPFRNKDWERKKVSDHTGDSFRPPRDDVNAPDMYIPAMAFVTYMLFVGMALGQRNAFTPEILGLTSSKAAAVVLVEILAIKGSVYALNIPGEVIFLDLIAYMGYKFVGMIADILADMLAGSQAYWLVYFYTNLALAFFLMRTLRHNLVVSTDMGGMQAGRRRRNYFLLAIAGSQLLSTYFLTHY